LAERYECQPNGSCLYIEDLIIANNTNLTIAPTQRYRIDPTTGFLLRVMTAVSSQVALLTTMSGVGQITCSALCAQPPTPTPTGTPTPTPTSTPEPPTPTPTATPTNTPEPPTPTPTATATPTPTPTNTPVPIYYYGTNYCDDTSGPFCVSDTLYMTGATFNIGPNTCLYLVGFVLPGEGYFDLDTLATYVGTCADITCQPPVSTYTVSWSNNSVATGTNVLDIWKNGTNVVNQSGSGSGTFSVLSTDVITYSLASTTPDFTDTLISVNSYGTGTVFACGFNSSTAQDLTGISFNANGTIDGVTQNYTDACP
jgi:hypothetical protein